MNSGLYGSGKPTSALSSMHCLDRPQDFRPPAGMLRPYRVVEILLTFLCLNPVRANAVLQLIDQCPKPFLLLTNFNGPFTLVLLVRLNVARQVFTVMAIKQVSKADSPWKVMIFLKTAINESCTAPLACSSFFKMAQGRPKTRCWQKHLNHHPGSGSRLIGYFQQILVGWSFSLFMSPLIY